MVFIFFQNPAVHVRPLLVVLACLTHRVKVLFQARCMGQHARSLRRLLL